MPISIANARQVAFAGLMRDGHAAAICQPRRRLHHGHVDCVRALGPPDQNPRRRIAAAAARGGILAVVLRNSWRIGFPATKASPKNDTVDSNVTAAADTTSRAAGS